MARTVANILSLNHEEAIFDLVLQLIKIVF